MAGTYRRGFGNIIGHVEGISDMGSLSAWSAEQLDPTLNWDDVAWIKERWGGRLVSEGYHVRRRREDSPSDPAPMR